MVAIRELSKHLLFIAAVVSVFLISGHVASYCESLHDSLLMSSAIFTSVFTAISAGCYRLYELLTFKFFG